MLTSLAVAESSVGVGLVGWMFVDVRVRRGDGHGGSRAGVVVTSAAFFDTAQGQGPCRVRRYGIEVAPVRPSAADSLPRLGVSTKTVSASMLIRSRGVGFRVRCSFDRSRTRIHTQDAPTPSLISSSCVHLVAVAMDLRYRDYTGE